MQCRHPLLAVLILGWLTCLLIAGREDSPAVADAQGPAPAPAPEAANVDSGRPSTNEELLQQQARLEELKAKEADLRMHQRAAAKMESARHDLQVFRQADWSALISTNRQAFQALRQKAAHSSTETTQCTVCAGRGVMGSCVLCKHTGKCPTCHGTGKASRDEYCPTCVGKGKCYLCFGSGQMACPFCDDGTVSLKRPLPPMMLPN